MSGYCKSCGVIIEPDPLDATFLCESHNVEYPAETLDKIERAVDITLPKLEAK